MNINMDEVLVPVDGPTARGRMCDRMRDRLRRLVASRTTTPSTEWMKIVEDLHALIDLAEETDDDGLWGASFTPIETKIVWWGRDNGLLDDHPGMMEVDFLTWGS